MQNSPKRSMKSAIYEFSATAEELQMAEWELAFGREQDSPNGLERRFRLVKAAYDLVGEDGIEGFTIRSVLKRTGLSRRAFYECYGGKDDLLLAVFEWTIRIGAYYLGQQLAGYSCPLTRLEFIVTSIIAGNGVMPGSSFDGENRRSVAMSREHLRLAESRLDDLHTALEPLLTLISDQLKDGIEQGLVRKTDPQRLAVLVFNLVSTSIQTELLARSEDRGCDVQVSKARTDQLAAELWEFCRRGLIA